MLLDRVVGLQVLIRKFCILDKNLALGVMSNSKCEQFLQLSLPLKYIN